MNSPGASHPLFPLHDALGLRRSGELVSIVGGGGKSTLLFALAARAAEDTRWVLSTTTRMFASQIALATAHCSAEPRTLADNLDATCSGLLVIGEVDGEKAVGVPAGLPSEILRHPNVDSVAVEADGSRRLPTKAPAEHEPVIASGTTLTAIVAGLDSLEGTIARVAHRPERVAALLDSGTDEPLTPDGLAMLLSHPAGGLKDIPLQSRVAVVLNKADTPSRRANARATASQLIGNSRIERVLIGALHAGGADWETWQKTD